MVEKKGLKNTKRLPKGQRAFIRRQKQKARNEAVLAIPKK